MYNDPLPEEASALGWLAIRGCRHNSSCGMECRGNADAAVHPQEGMSKSRYEGLWID
jgi:hypothetical protein